MKRPPSSAEIIRAALKQDLIDEDNRQLQLRLLPGISPDEYAAVARSLPVPLPDDLRDLLTFCSGIEGTLHQLDFTGRSFGDGSGLEFLMPHSHTIAEDACGNFWAFDLRPAEQLWGPLYYCCHDAPVFLLQAHTLAQFLTEVFRMYTPPHQSLIEKVQKDRIFDVWRNNPGIIAHIEALASSDPDLAAFAQTLDPAFSLIDLRAAEIGMGFSWGRYGVKTEVIRFGTKPIFAYKKPPKTGVLSKLFG